MGGFVGVQPRRSQGVRLPVNWVIGEPASTSEFSGTKGKRLLPWKNIKGRLVLPILEALDSHEKGRQAMFVGQFDRVMGFFDHTRRVSISPTEEPAVATFNLGIASLQY